VPSPGLEPGRFGLKDAYLQVNSSVSGQFSVLSCAELRSDFASSGHISGHVLFDDFRHGFDTSAAKHSPLTLLRDWSAMNAITPLPAGRPDAWHRAHRVQRCRSASAIAAHHPPGAGAERREGLRRRAFGEEQGGSDATRRALLCGRRGHDQPELVTPESGIGRTEATPRSRRPSIEARRSPGAPSARQPRRAASRVARRPGRRPDPMRSRGE
jgi:hypothetical protein